MRHWNLQTGIDKPASEWKRPGKVESPDLVAVYLDKRRATAALAQIANYLDSGREDESDCHLLFSGEMKRDMSDERAWVPLSTLLPGTVFEAESGWRGVRTAEEHAPDVWMCIDLGNGTRVKEDGATLVREIAL